jgi:HEAT repeat protein
VRGVVLFRKLTTFVASAILAAGCLIALADTRGSDRNAETMAWLEGILRGQHINTDTASLIEALAPGHELIVRSSAAQLLGLRKELTAINALKGALHSDQEPLVRETAAWALANMGDQEGKTALKDLIPRSEDLRRQSILAAELAELGDPSMYSFAVKAVASSSPETRFLSVANLFPFVKYQGKTGAEVIDPLQRLQGLAHDKDPKVRGEALSVLNRASPEFMPRSQLQPLVEQLSKQDPDPQVRATADRILQVWKLEGGKKGP